MMADLPVEVAAIVEKVAPALPPEEPRAPDEDPPPGEPGSPEEEEIEGGGGGLEGGGDGQTMSAEVWNSGEGMVEVSS